MFFCLQMLDEGNFVICSKAEIKPRILNTNFVLQVT